jgi:hypothetical protein
MAELGSLADEGSKLDRRPKETRLSAFALEFKNARQILRERGGRALWQKYGWKAVAAILAAYLVRDVVVYLLLPFFVMKSLT